MSSLRYRSTRSAEPLVSFREALLGGLAPDGGLYVPAAIPAVPESAWREAASFPDLAFNVLHRWLAGEVDAAALRALVADAFSFPVPVVPLEGAWEGVYVLELFHGPTLSFKDFGARTMARLMGHFLQAEDTSLTILVATSGDTGSAVADGFAGQDRIQVVLLYPKGQVSPVQERQLIVERPGVQALAVEGTFDDCQRMVKAAFVDEELAVLNLSSANSINIGRLLPQMLYYLWASRSVDAPPVVCVPSGNLGNLTGGVLAALSGLPVHRFLAAHNANDFFPKYLRGEADAFQPSVRTLSNAMDVGAPSNFERLSVLLGEAGMRDRIEGERVTDEETLDSMRRVYEESGYVACPHTAVGLEAARRYRQRCGTAHPVLVLSTAHPAKFPETVGRALGAEPALPERLSRLWHRPTRVATLPPTAEALRERLLAHAGV
ncbi:threonine synthase [Rhodothermaceae bacterium RA]|nr:threonine synthase [Rhodothermaceae bacterium RA]